MKNEKATPAFKKRNMTNKKNKNRMHIEIKIMLINQNKLLISNLA